MKIAQVAPLWECVPPKAYGGTELVVYSLCEELTKQGHDVTLFACGGSQTSANLITCTDRPLREAGIANALYPEMQEITQVLERADEFDIIHNHLGYQFLPFTTILNTPVVTTLHGAFILPTDIAFCNEYQEHNYISISDYQRKGAPDLNYTSTVYNGIDVERYPYQEVSESSEPYFAFLGRISEEKGTHLSIEIAKATGMKLVIAGKIGDHDIEYYETKVKHLIDGEQIVYIGELGHVAKCELLKNAYATLHTVQWPEPFGLVMAESMACGTPVLALRDGSIPEVIKDGVTGFVADNIDELIAAIDDIDKIKRSDCRKHIEDNFTTQRMTNAYLEAYQSVINKPRINACPDIKTTNLASNKRIS